MRLFSKAPPKGKFYFGICPDVPLVGLPAGRVRLRLRNDSFPVTFVRMSNGNIRKFIYVGGTHGWIEKARNSSIPAAIR